jgi:hypothetical protein
VNTTKPTLREWLLDRPRAAWREWTPGNAQQALVNDEMLLHALAKRGTPLQEI